MSWQEALETVVVREGVERYRYLCSDAYHDHAAWRAEMVRREANPTYPSVGRHVANLFRSARRFVASGLRLAPKSIRQARLTICQACPKYDQQQRRCTVCGCVNSAKVWVAADQCPLDPPKWRSVPLPPATNPPHRVADPS
jgi:hypothetical protein